MPFGLSIPGISSDHQQKQEASLDDILPNTNQRTDLILLVAICTDHMREVLVAAFENENASTDSRHAAEPANLGQEGQHAKENDSQKSRTDLPWASNVELASPRMQNLKEEGVTYFNKWRTAVLKRMGAAMNVQSDTVKDAKAQHLAASSQPEQRQREKGQHVQTEGRGNQPDAPEQGTKIVVPLPSVVLPAALRHLDEKKRALLLGAVLFMLLSLENYPAYSRVLLSYLCQSLELPHDVLSSVEASTASTLLDAASKHSSGLDAEDARKKQADESAFGRKWKVGLATVAGAAVIGISGGLAAPLILGVAGSILGGVGLGGLATLLGATIVNPVTIGALFGALGGRMTSNAMSAYTKEVEDFKFLPIEETKFHSSKEESKEAKSSAAAPSHKLHIAIGISGWVTEEKDVSLPWRVLSSITVEPFALRYEQAALISLGTTLTGVLKSNAYSFVQGKAIGLVLPALAAAMAPMGLLKAGQFLDNPFTIAMERSDKAGKVLAHALMDKAQGERPVTLIGFSLGARVVHSCLEELAAQNAFGLVEDAILIGSPVPSAEMTWRRMRAMVVGRLINVYTQGDMLLGYLYRARNLQLGVAGLQAITSPPNVENKDVSNIVTGHNQYCLAIGRILKELNFADLDLDAVEQEDVELLHEKIHEKQVYDEAKREGRLGDIEDEHGHFMMGDASEANNDKKEENSNAMIRNDNNESLLAEQLGKTHINN